MRFAHIDRLLLVASFAIVVFHVRGEPILGGLGLPVFLLAVFAFGTRRDEPVPAPLFLRARARRLLVPWLFWSAAYLLLEAWRPDPAHDVTPLRGAAPHLWFLPYAFVLAVLARPLHRRAVRMEPRAAVRAFLLIAVVLGAVVNRHGPGRPFPFDAWLLGAPAPFLGVAFGRVLAMEPAERRRVALRIAVVALPVGVLLHAARGVEPGSRWLLAAGLFALAAAWTGRVDPVSRALTTVRYGVYCVHFALVVHQPWLEPGLPRALVVYALSASLIVLLRRTPVRRLLG